MINWLVEGLIPENQLILVAGQPGHGKSWLMNSLAVDVSQGELFLKKFKATKSSIIYIDEDTPTDVLISRLERLAKVNGRQLNASSIHSMEGFHLFNDGDRKKLINDIKNLISSKQKVLVIIDCLVKVCSGENLDRTDSASRAMQLLTTIRDAGATVIVVHHMSLKRAAKIENEDLLGLVMNNTAIVSACDTAFIVLKAPIKNENIFIIIPKARRQSLTYSDPFAAKLDANQTENWATITYQQEIPKLPTDEAKVIFKLFYDDSVEYTVNALDIALEKDLSQSDIRKTLRELVSEGCLEKRVDPHNKTHAVIYWKNSKFSQDSFYKKNLDL